MPCTVYKEPPGLTVVVECDKGLTACPMAAECCTEVGHRDEPDTDPDPRARATFWRWYAAALFAAVAGALAAIYWSPK